MEGISKLGRVRVGRGQPVRIAAALNLSPESFYKGSVATSGKEVSARASQALEDGADLLDLGAMSTAPYLKTEVSPEVEGERILAALKAVTGSVGAGVTISVDTVRASVASLALRNGATVVNDVSGLKSDPEMARVVREAGASLIAMANSPGGARHARPTSEVKWALRESLRIAAEARVDERLIVLDPGIGFYRAEGGGRAFSPQGLMPWYEWDLDVIAGLDTVLRLGRPVCVGLSRKSFLGRFGAGRGPEERLPASLGATAIAVMNGAGLVRTHDVRETLQAVRVAEAVLRRRPWRRPAS